MKLHQLISLGLAAVLALSLTACGPEAPAESASSGSGSSSSAPAKPEPPVEGFNSPFTMAVFPSLSMHPVLSSNRANLTLASLLYEPLFQVDGQFQTVPVLCGQSAVSPDKRVWTFTLRPEAVFSDGTPLTGAIVADALNLARKEPSRYAPRLRDVASITGRGQEVVITLSAPNGRLPALLDIPIALGTGNRPAGTGPYTLTDTDGSLSLTARSDWWQGGKLPAQTLALQPIRTSDELLYAFDTGDVSMVEVDMMGSHSLSYSNSSQVWDYPTTSLIYLGFNTARGLGGSPEFRRAVNQALDRSALVQTIFANHAAAADLPVHPASALAPAAPVFPYEPQVLVETLSNLSRYRQKLTLVVNSESAAKVSAAQLIAYQLEGAGLSIQIRKLPFEDYTAALAGGNFDLYLGEVNLTADFDLAPLLAPGGALNYGGWFNPQAPGLLEALKTADSDGAPQAAKALSDLLAQDPPIAAVCFKNGSVLSQWGRLAGLSPVRGNVFYQLGNWMIQ